jgi:hypothetical protein
VGIARCDRGLCLVGGQRDLRQATRVVSIDSFFDQQDYDPARNLAKLIDSFGLRMLTIQSRRRCIARGQQTALVVCFPRAHRVLRIGLVNIR